MVQRGANYERQEREFYPTPEPEVELALRHFPRQMRILCDPCCGDGAMLRVFERNGLIPLGTDVHPLCSGKDIVRHDFLGDKPFPFDGPFDIFTNPPFGQQGALAEAFIRRCLNLVRPWGGDVTMLLPVDFDSGGTRAGLFKRCPQFAEKAVLLHRIVWFEREGGASPSANWSWFRWSFEHKGPPTLSYIE